jgi:hypothetical protein
MIMRWVGHVARIKKTRNSYGVFMGKSEGKRPIGRHGFEWKENIRMDSCGSG